MTNPAFRTEAEIAEWRAFLEEHPAVDDADVEELEGHLREQIAELAECGLAPDEAFLVAVRRMGSVDEISRAFAREYSGRLWKQLVVPTARSTTGPAARTEALVVVAVAIAAAISVKLPALFGRGIDEENALFYLRNGSLFVLPFLVGYFAWKRKLPARPRLWIALAYGAALVFANVFPFAEGSDTEVLLILHLPISVWLIVGVAYAGGRWSGRSCRMDFVRFSGELFIYYVLIAMGGGVLTGITLMMFASIGLDAELLAVEWLIPCGMAGAVVVGSWLVELKQGVIENVAPVLARLFTPLFAVVLLVFFGTMVWAGRPITVEREVLIAFDLLLVVVVCLLLYNTSARDPRARPGPFDVLQLLLYVSALAVDVVALGAIAARITEFGFTPNRVAALGENFLLLIHLAWSTQLYARFLRSRTTFDALERWQTSYLPVYSAWAGLVVIAFPLIFGFA